MRIRPNLTPEPIFKTCHFLPILVKRCAENEVELDQLSDLLSPIHLSGTRQNLI